MYTNKAVGGRKFNLNLGVAQFGSVLEWGSRGREFKSPHSDQKWLEALLYAIFYFYQSNKFNLSYIIYTKGKQIMKGYINMNNCPDLFFLSAIAYNLSQCLNEDELGIVAADITALGDMLEAILARRALSDGN